MLRWFTTVGILCTSLTAADYNRVPAGQLKGARPSWSSTSSIKIGVGYGEVSGSYWEIGATDPLATTGYTLTGLTSTANGVVHYLYIDRANSSFPDVAIRNSTTAPVWSDSFMGWYDGADRCIAAVWINPNGTIADFYCSADDTYAYVAKTFSPGSPATGVEAWSNVDLSAYVPANSHEISVGLSLVGSWSFSKAGLWAGGANSAGNVEYEHGTTKAFVNTWLLLDRGHSKIVKWMANCSSTSGTVTLFIRGYRLER